MAGNNNDLILQFARGTEALNVLEQLDDIAQNADIKLARALDNYHAACRDIRSDAGREMGAIIARSRLTIDSLTPSDDDDDDGNDDDG